MNRRSLVAVLLGTVLIATVATHPTARATADVAEFSFQYGNPGDIPVMGDWNGDGVDTPGVVRGDTWYLSDGFDATVSRAFAYGIAGDTMVVGDWNGDGVDTPGAVRGNTWYLSNSFGGTGDLILQYGDPGDVQLVGDWNGDGVDTPGVVRGDTWWLSDDFSANVARTFAYGLAGDHFIAGDWNADGIDTPGAVRGANWYLSNSFGGTGDHIFVYGYDGDMPVAGDYNADGVDSFGVFRDSWWFLRNTFPVAQPEPTATPSAEPTASPGSTPPAEEEPLDETIESYGDGDRQLAATEPAHARYAPIVYLHPDEDYFPADPLRFFIRHSQLTFSNQGESDYDVNGAGPGQINAIRLGYRSWLDAYAGPYGFFAWQLTRPFQLGRDPRLDERDGFFLNLQNEYRHGQPGVLSQVPVLYQHVKGRYISYWFFYAFNKTRPRGIDSLDYDHEGDWERIVVKLDGQDQPTHVAYYRHGCEPAKLAWPDAPRVNDRGVRDANGTHPVVYSALGRHGSYARVTDGTRSHCQSGSIGDDRVAGGGRVWRTWNAMSRVRAQPWDGFGGAWGEVGCCEPGADFIATANTTGPLGPIPGRDGPPAGW